MDAQWGGSTKVVSAQVRRVAAPHASQPCLLRMVRASQARTNAIQTIAGALHSPRARVRGHLGGTWGSPSKQLLGEKQWRIARIFHCLAWF